MRVAASILLLLASALACAEPARDEPVRPRFTERLGGSGIDFLDSHGRVGTAKQHLIETLGGGVAMFDFDADGDLDLFFTNGDPRDGSDTGASRLFRNDGAFSFSDVTEAAGLGRRHDATGVAVGDVDNDGYDDLFVTAYGANVLYRNRGDGRFEDVSEAAGIDHEGYASSAAFADLDGDGDLDLFVCNYLIWDAATIELSLKGGTFHEARVIAGPRGFTGAPDVLYRNRFADSGELRFDDVTADAGLGASRSFALGVVAVDFDDDGDVDLYVANDSKANSLFVNDGAMHFEDRAMNSGAALDHSGNAQAGMGVDCRDVDGDGLGDFFLTNFSHDYNTLYRNLGGSFFEDASKRVGLVEPSFLSLGFGCVLFDADLDGDQDIAVANGHVFPNIGDTPLNTTYEQPNQLFENVDGQTLRAIESPWVTDRADEVSRGLARGDLDGDGREDLVFTQLNGPPSLLRNETDGGHAVVLRLVGSVSNRNAIGARLAVEVEGSAPRVYRVLGGGSYLSAGSRDVVIGLAAAASCHVIVRWPSGSESSIGEIAAGTLVTVEEGSGEVSVEALEPR